MRRIVVMGQTCAGKSTVAAILARRRGLTLIDLDAIHWMPGAVWTEREMDAKRQLVGEAAQRERWVVDGFSNFMREAMMGRADFVVWIDLPPYRVAPRVVTRTLRRWIRKERVCGDNLESPRHLFDKGSLLRYLWRSGRKNAEKYAAAFADFQALGVEAVRFGSTREAVEWAEMVEPL